MHSAQKHPYGFTLIEMSIVLVIIGLLVGGVLVGRDLIKSSETRSQITQLVSIKTAHIAFKEKYGCIAGDCSDSSTSFGSAPALNGNNDGKVQCWLGGATVDECAIYFFSLRTAGLINDIAVYGAQTEYYRGKMKESIMYVNYNDRYDPSQTPDAAAYVHLIRFNSPFANGGVFTPNEAFQIDKKYDDGLRNSGNIFGLTGYTGGVAGTAMPCLSGGVYDLTQTVSSCRLDFKIE